MVLIPKALADVRSIDHQRTPPSIEVDATVSATGEPVRITFSPSGREVRRADGERVREIVEISYGLGSDLWLQFAAKVALGCAAKLLDDGWLDSRLARALQSVLWHGAIDNTIWPAGVPGYPGDLPHDHLLHQGLGPHQHLIGFQQTPGGAASASAIVVLFGGELAYRLPVPGLPCGDSGRVWVIDWSTQAVPVCEDHDAAVEAAVARPRVVGFSDRCGSPALMSNETRSTASPGLGSPLAAEIQFGLQCRSDQRQAGMPRDAFSTVRLRLLDRGVRSLLDLDSDDEVFADPLAGRFLAYARDRVDELAHTASGLTEWDREVWRIARLPGVKRRGCSTSTMSFEFCDSRWLRSLFKQWLQWRLASGITASSAAWNLRALQLLVEYSDLRGTPLRRSEDFTRELLEGFIVHLRTVGLKPLSANRLLGAVRTFLDDCRRHDWMAGLDPKATYYREDYSRRPEQLPRYLSDHVMAQLESQLDRLPTLTVRTAVEILIGTGLRARDALELDLDALTTDTAGAPYLRYFNHKLSRERFIPISDTLAATIRRQQAHVRDRFPTSRYLLPRERANPDGARPFSYHALTYRLNVWERACAFSEADGSPAHVTAHR